MLKLLLKLLSLLHFFGRYAVVTVIFSIFYACAAFMAHGMIFIEICSYFASLLLITYLNPRTDQAPHQSEIWV